MKYNFKSNGFSRSFVITRYSYVAAKNDVQFYERPMDLTVQSSGVLTPEFLGVGEEGVTFK